MASRRPPTRRQTPAWPPVRGAPALAQAPTSPPPGRPPDDPPGRASAGRPRVATAAALPARATASAVAGVPCSLACGACGRERHGWWQCLLAYLQPQDTLFPTASCAPPSKSSPTWPCSHRTRRSLRQGRAGRTPHNRRAAARTRTRNKCPHANFWAGMARHHAHIAGCRRRRLTYGAQGPVALHNACGWLGMGASAAAGVPATCF